MLVHYVLGLSIVLPFVAAGLAMRLTRGRWARWQIRFFNKILLGPAAGICTLGASIMVMAME